MFDVDRWFHLAWPPRVPREAHDDIVRGMQEARAAWLKHAESTLLSHPSHELRGMLGRSGNRFHMKAMDNRQVAKALYNEVKDGNLLFVPERDPMRKCVEAIRKQREKGARQAPAGAQEPTGADVAKVLHDNGPRAPRHLRNAQSFEYKPDAPGKETEELAASTNNPRYAAKMPGYDQNTFSDMLHVFKPANGPGPADNVIFHDDGSVEFNGQTLDDNIHNYAP
ncbi:hypothetical protein [Paraburkholderia ferrariae]|uniref:hypothetical protein n=1 Tax=Paraburkholderia ferrariae TaxID=386056 RepID=UPI000693772D|nr:hypothetical protein [Paraburkholderia ferrariae]